MKTDSLIWVTLFWIIILFTSINAIAKSFMLESKSRYLYYYSIASPISILVSKLIYNTGLLIVLCALCWVLYAFILGNPIQQLLWFSIAILLGSISISFILTLMSAIASKANNNSTLMSILSMPVLIPILLLLIKITLLSLDSNTMDFPIKDFLMLLSLDAIILALGFILFPFLWKE